METIGMASHFTRFCVILYLFFHVHAAYALTLIRDEELEGILRKLSMPVFSAAGLASDNISIYIVQDNQINAFVSGGQNIFLYTGLLTLSTSPAMAMGALAHETGHIAGGHLSRNVEAMKNAQYKTMLGYLLGAATAVVGSPAAGSAIIAGSQQTATRQFLQYSRGNEESADQAGLGYLEKVQYPADGLTELLQLLYQREKIAFGNQVDPYALTHPLSSERIAHIKNYVASRPVVDTGFSAQDKAAYRMAIVKLRAFINPPEETLRHYPATDTSDEAYYARAVAYYRQPYLQAALIQVNVLLERSPNQPFYHELKGQILLENSRVSESIPFYEKALELKPDSTLFKTQLASAYLATEKPQYLEQTIGLLNQVRTKEPENSFIRHQLGIAYGRHGELGLSNLVLAEEAILNRDKKTARHFIDLAEEMISPGSEYYIRLRDAKETLERDL